MTSPAPRPWLAALLALLCNGLGHLYAGRAGVAVAIQLAWVAAVAGTTFLLRAGPIVFVAGVALVTAWLVQAFLAARAARTARAAGAPRDWTSGLIALVGFYLATSALANVAVGSFRSTVAHTVYVPAASMLPTIEIGDYLVVASGKPAVLRGAVVEVSPLSSGSGLSHNMLKRIVAVGGDAVELRGGALWVNGAAVPREPVPGECRSWRRPGDGRWTEEPCLDFVETLDGRAFHTHCTPNLDCGDVERQVVPPGHVWLAGDFRDHSADSRVFGRVPESAIVGEVRWVAASWGPHGLRWSRMGRTIR